MKKALLIVGIILLAAGVLALLFAVLNLFMFHSVLDGSTALYLRLQQRAILFFVIGGVLVLLGIAGILLRRKL